MFSEKMICLGGAVLLLTAVPAQAQYNHDDCNHPPPFVSVLGGYPIWRQQCLLQDQQKAQAFAAQQQAIRDQEAAKAQARLGQGCVGVAAVGKTKCIPLEDRHPQAATAPAP